MKSSESSAAPTLARRGKPARVPLGTVLATAGARGQIDERDMAHALARHAAGDWGDLDPHDREQNETALREGLRLLVVYRDRVGRTFWVITEADRSATTVLLPDEY